MMNKIRLVAMFVAAFTLLAGCGIFSPAQQPEPLAAMAQGTLEVRLLQFPEEESEEEYPGVYPGLIDEDIYTNESIGLSFTLPEGWSFADDEIIEMMMGAGVELVAENGGYIDTADIVAIYDMIAFNANTDSNIMVMIEALPLELEPGTELPDATVHLEALQERLEEMDVFGFVFGRPFVTTLSGQDFDALPVTVDINDTPTRQYYFVRIHNLHMITIVASLFEDITVEELIGFFDL